MESATTDMENAGPWDDTLMRAVEALVFAADEPLTPLQIAHLFGEVLSLPAPEEASVLEAVDLLNKYYLRDGRTLRIQRWAGGLRMATAPEMAPFVHALFDSQKHRKLSRSLMEALAVLAYRQPATKSEVDFVRGVDSDYALRRLQELSLIRIEGRSEAIGRPMLYATTPRFLELFGLDRLEDLPSLPEIEEILNDPGFKQERARVLLQAGYIPGGSEDVDAPSGEEPQPPSTEH